MLFTRCPSCETTFRITAEALRKANGQVRCGRCANIFNAYAELREGTDADSETVPVGIASAEGAAESAEPLANDEPHRPGAAGIESAEGATAEEETDAVEADFGAAADSTAAGEHGTGETAAVDDPIGAGHDTDEAGPQSDDGTTVPELAWSLDSPGEPSTGPRDWWRYATAAAVLILIGQTVHHFRAELAAQTFVGPPLQRAYGVFGATLAPRWDVSQYEVVDWIATAEPSATGQGNLIIAARIYNGGPRAQPYPHVHLELKDRWESAVGSRVFRPSEYLDATVPADTLMAAGDTAQARLTVVDPGPDAYGFELDICVEGESEQLSCKADRVFQ